MAEPLSQPDFLTPYAPQAAREENEDPRRREPRPRTFLGGKLVFGAQDLTGDCTVRNLTPHGAKVQTSLAANLSPELWLIIIKQGMAYRCKVAWRRGEEVGLRFLSEHNLAEDADPRLKVVRYVWRQLTER